MDSVNHLSRGIPNVSGVACHLSSALQLLLHAVPPLQQALLEISEHPSATAIPQWLQELTHLTRTLFSKETCVNPMPLYDSLSQTTSLDPNELGDAAKALRVILHLLKQQDLLQPILKQCLVGGAVEQTMIGESIQRGQRIRRIKVKERNMSCPFPLCVTYNVTSLEQALEKTTVKPQPIIGMDWNQVSDYRQEQEDCAEVDCDWTTHKTTTFTCLPQHLLFHLQRFGYQNDSVQLSRNVIDIPRQVDVTPFINHEECRHSPCCLQYKFTGAILHVSDDETYQEEEEDGHYVTLVQADNKACWYLFDDDQVTLLSDKDEVLHFLSGRPGTNIELEGMSCATVLIYSKTCNCTDCATADLMSGLRERLQQQVIRQSNASPDWSQPQVLVGRRLSVRWKSGKYYPGIVSSYNNESGKHCVQYDDGDVRHYDLSKKTIEWIDSQQ